MPVDETFIRPFVDKLRRFLKEEGGLATTTIRTYTLWCRKFMIYIVRNNGSDATYPSKILKFEIKLPRADAFHGKLPGIDASTFISMYLKVCYIVK